MLNTILLIEDDPDDQYLFNNALKIVDKSIVLSIAKNGLTAFERLQIIKPDLIFLDLNMPVMNGIEFLAKIRNTNHKEVPVIVYSTHINDHEKITDMGAHVCIEKPSRFEDTVEAIRNVVSVFKNNSYHSRLKSK